MDLAMQIAESLFERNAAPDWLVRFGIRQLLRMRLSDESSADISDEMCHKMLMCAKLRKSAIAVHQDKANEQHYEVPTDFFLLHLGKRLKYSSAFYERPDMTLDQAEEAMLQRYCDLTGLQDGMNILDLGCGWGSLSLYIAEKYPNCQITSVSNSSTQRKLIEARARSLKTSAGDNLKVVTNDVTELTVLDRAPFDIVFSIEMFEHMRNYADLLNKIDSWLKTDGKLFVHIFCHSKFIYCLETEGATNWLGRHFFTGGTMPSDDVLNYFQDDLRVVDRWRVNGNHYAQTAEHWLQNFDRNVEKIRPALQTAYGKEATKWEAYWRTFYMSVAELFGYNNGQEWHVAFYLFEKQRK